MSGVSIEYETDPLIDDPYKLWVSPTSYNEDIPEARQLDTTFRGHYKSSFVLDWEERGVNMVRRFH